MSHRRALPLLALWIALGVFAAASPATAEPVELRLRLEPGQTYTFHMVSDQRITQKIQGFEQKISQTIRMVYENEVLEKTDDGDYRIRVTYTAAGLKQSGPQGNIDYDSARDRDKPLPPQAKGYAALLGQSFEHTLSPTGKVGEVTGIEKMVDRMIEGMELPPGPQGAMVERNIREQFNSESVRASMELMAATYPERAVSVGDEWSAASVANLGMIPAKIENNYTFASSEGGRATLDLQSRVDTSDKEPVDLGPIKMKFDLTGDQTGSITLDEQTGLTIRSTIEQDFSGNMHLSGPNFPQEMTIPMTIEGTTTITDPAKAETANASGDAD